MKPFFHFARFTVVFVLFGLWSLPLAAGETVQRNDLEGLFHRHNTSGTFVLLDVSKQTLTLVGDKRAKQRFIAATATVAY